MLDYDGTLAPFHSERGRAEPYPGVVLLLGKIIHTQRTKVVIISGREANEIPQLLNLDSTPEIWGLHGLQRRTSDGIIHASSLDARSGDGLRDAEQWLLYQGLHSAAELKGSGVAVHWRGLDSSRAEEWRGRVLLGWNPIAQRSGLRLLEFDGGVEICARQSDKGVAVRALLREAGPDAPAAYLGDDTTDECAFRALAGRGLAVLVRPRFRKTAAQLWFQPPEDLLDFLHQWLNACQTSNASGTQAEAAVNQ
jgi:trehalose 6-phosphate phosphatase